MEFGNVMCIVGLLFVAAIIALLVQHECVEKPALVSECAGVCAAENMTLHAMDYPQCLCAPIKAHYENVEIRTFYITK